MFGLLEYFSKHKFIFYLQQTNAQIYPPVNSHLNFLLTAEKNFKTT